MKRNDNAWQLDRRIPIAVIFALLLQLASALIWATELNARVALLEQESIGSSNFNERFGRVEERLEHLKEDSVSIKRQLEQLTNRLIKN